MTPFTKLLLVCAVAQVGQALRCNSPLRRYYPQFFTHCCVYSEWSEWTYVNKSVEEDRACSSGKSYGQTRHRLLMGLPWGCEASEVETRRKCATKAEVFIGELGLGKLGTQRVQSLHNDNLRRDAPLRPSKAARCPTITGEDEYLCSDLYRSIGQRSAARGNYIEELSSESNSRQSQKTIPEVLSPLPFVREEDDHILSRRQSKDCEEVDDVQYILFLLDTSGSIGGDNFSRITEAIGTMTALFCKPIQVAVMTFNHYFQLEFCFDCYDNDPAGRDHLGQTIKNITYREGQTYSAAASRCACMEVLNETCGLPPDAKSIDVVLITDGHSNDPFLQFCDEVKCFHNRGAHTYVIATGDYNDGEIQCVNKPNDPNDIHLLLGHATIDDIEAIFLEAVEILTNSTTDEFSCINHDGFLCDW